MAKKQWNRGDQDGGSESGVGWLSGNFIDGNGTCQVDLLARPQIVSGIDSQGISAKSGRNVCQRKAQHGRQEFQIPPNRRDADV